MSHVFINYVSEDTRVVDFICKVLERNGVNYWRDKNDISPGDRWKSSIKNAIESGNYFVPFFTRNYVQKQNTVANEELIIAIEQLRRMPQNRRWFIPLRLDECNIPDRPIGAGESIKDLQYIDFPSLAWKEALRKFLISIRVENPILDHDEPLGAGFPSMTKISGGKLTYRGSEPTVAGFAGMVMNITGGWITREENIGILVNFKTQAPFEQMQTNNQRLGLSDVIAVCNEDHFSTGCVNNFSGSRNILLHKGENLWQNVVGDIKLPMDMTVETAFRASGTLDGNVLSGTFEADLKVSQVNHSQKQWGDFEIILDPNS